MSYKRDFLPDYNNTKTMPNLIRSTLDNLGLKPQDVIGRRPYGDKDHYIHTTRGVEVLQDHGTYFPTATTILNDLNFYIGKLQDSRKMLRTVDTRSIKARHMSDSTTAMNAAINQRYEKSGPSAFVLDPKQFWEKVKADERDEWDKTELDRLFFPLTFAVHTQKMDFNGWVSYLGKKMLPVYMLEKKQPDWATEQGVSIFKVILVEPFNHKTPYRSIEKKFRYHNNIWLLTANGADEKLTAAHSDFGRARSMIEQYLKTEVLNELEGVL